MSVHLKIENSREGLVATILQRDDDTRKVIGRPSVFLVETKEKAQQQAKTLARSLGLKVYRFADKSGASDALQP